MAWIQYTTIPAHSSCGRLQLLGKRQRYAESWQGDLLEIGCPNLDPPLCAHPGVRQYMLHVCSLQMPDRCFAWGNGCCRIPDSLLRRHSSSSAKGRSAFALKHDQVAKRHTRDVQKLGLLDTACASEAMLSSTADGRTSPSSLPKPSGHAGGKACPGAETVVLPVSSIFQGAGVRPGVFLLVNYLASILQKTTGTCQQSDDLTI